MKASNLCPAGRGNHRRHSRLWTCDGAAGRRGRPAWVSSHGGTGTSRPGHTLSITELEYREAVRLDKPVLVFLPGEDAPWPQSLMDIGASAAQVERLRAALRDRCVCGEFTDAASLAAEVTATVARWLTRGHRRDRRRVGGGGGRRALAT